MIKKLNITNKVVAKRILDIQLPSYRIEAGLIDFYDIPALKDTVETLQHCGEKFYGYFVEEELVGAVSYKIEEQKVLDIHRMIVHPSHLKKGIASSLLDYIQHNDKNVERVIVSTGAKNIPAKNLYKRYGFIEVEEKALPVGVTITLFEKKL